MGLAVAIIVLSSKVFLNGVPVLDEVVHTLYPCLHDSLVPEVPLPHLLRQSVKGIADADKF